MQGSEFFVKKNFVDKKKKEIWQGDFFEKEKLLELLEKRNFVWKIRLKKKCPKKKINLLGKKLFEKIFD